MASLLFRARNAVLAATLGVAVAPSALAADMPFFAPPAPEPVNEQPVEWGTGWYLRGDVGAAHLSPTNLDGVILSPSFPNNWTVGLGGGYQFNNWFRGEISVDYESLYNKSGPVNIVDPCQIGATPVLNALNQIVGSNPVFAGCSPIVHARTETMTVLANAYVDLGTWYGLTPYVGAGVGVNVMSQKSQTNWFMQNMVSYAGVTWNDPFSNQTYMANWDRAYNGQFLRVAYALMGGVAYSVTDHIKLDFGYRWLNLGKIDGVDLYNRHFSKDIIVNQARVGFRYMID